MHRFSRCEWRDDYPFHYTENNDTFEITKYHHERRVGLERYYYHRGRLPPSNYGHVKRVQGTPLQLLIPRNSKRGSFREHDALPAVPMIKGLIISRQFPRQIHVGTLSRLLSQSFVGLKWFRYEGTVPLGFHDEIALNRGTKELSLSTIIKLQQLT